MAKNTQPVTKVIDTLETAKVKSQKDLTDKGVRLGSPISGKAVGEEFRVTLNGKIELREFNGVTAAYYLTNEGYSIKVNASFDPTKHKAGTSHTAQCLEFTPEGGTPRKYCAFVD